MDISESFQSESQKIIDAFKKEAAVIRGNRGTPALIEDIKASYFGELLPLKQLGSIKAVPPKEIDITVWDKNAAPAVLKAIEASNLGFSAQLEGGTVRIHLPELSAERRLELGKQVKRISEEFKIQLRRLRDETNKKITEAEKRKEIGEDEQFKLKEKVQETTEEKNKQIEEALNAKLQEINK